MQPGAAPGSLQAPYRQHQAAAAVPAMPSQAPAAAAAAAAAVTAAAGPCDAPAPPGLPALPAAQPHGTAAATAVDGHQGAVGTGPDTAAEDAAYAGVSLPGQVAAAWPQQQQQQQQEDRVGVPGSAGGAAAGDVSVEGVVLPDGAAPAAVPAAAPALDLLAGAVAAVEAAGTDW